MPRVYEVKKCRKSPGKCSRCARRIKKGQPYIWWKFNYGPKYVRCDSSACYPHPSELTRSEFQGRIADLKKGGIGGDTFEELKDARQTVVDELESLAEDCQEKYDNMPENFQNGDTGQLLQEREQACRDAASALENIDIPEEAPPESPDDDSDTTEYDEANNDYLSRVESLRGDLEDALGELDCS